jgi:DNA-binding transcriptional LysR family regulator
MSRGLALAALGALLLTACDRFPRDPEHSLDDIRARGILRVGVPQDMPPEAGALLQRLESATGARTRRTAGPVEPLLQAVEDGDIDLVIAPFRKDTPSATANALSPPICTEGSGKKAIEWRAAMRNGENRWISLVEINARQVARSAK